MKAPPLLLPGAIDRRTAQKLDQLPLPFAHHFYTLENLPKNVSLILLALTLAPNAPTLALKAPIVIQMVAFWDPKSTLNGYFGLTCLVLKSSWPPLDLSGATVVLKAQTLAPKAPTR